MRFLFLLFVILALGGCHNPQKRKQLSLWMKPSEKIKVLSTTAMIDDLVSEIGQDLVIHRALIQGELDPHSYELVKGDLEKFGAADVVFYNGLGLEHGASLAALLKSEKKAIAIGDIVAEEKKEQLIVHDGQIDPHIWMDVSLFAGAVSPIVETLCKADPAHESLYRERGKHLFEKLEALDQTLQERLQKIPQEKRYLITSHDAFFYFARRYLAEQDEKQWRFRFAAPEGLAPDGQISPQDIQKIIDHAELNHIKMIFPESNLNQDGVKKIVSVLKKRGKEAFLSDSPLYGDTMGEQGSGAESYIQMMEHNLLVIEKGLSK